MTIEYWRTDMADSLTRDEIRERRMAKSRVQRGEEAPKPKKKPAAKKAPAKKKAASKKKAAAKK